MPIWTYALSSTVLMLIFLPKIGWILGLIVVSDREVGIIIKKFSNRSLPPGQIVALDGEAGLQADTLPPGWHFGYFPWQYSVRKDPVVVVPQDEIGLIVANHQGFIEAIAFQPGTTQILASGSRDKMIKIWDSDRILQTLNSHTQAVNAIAFSPDGQQLASGSSDRSKSGHRVLGNF
jgi:WD40 repeat protein